jgi:diguanylate cyclase (GGDEF)-like protein
MEGSFLSSDDNYKKKEMEKKFPVLVVEDDPVTRRLLCKTIAGEGHRVAEAENGILALEILKKSFFPIVVTDWMMPEMDGLQLCRWIRKDLNSGYVYIVVLTARDSREDILKGFEKGADDYLTKPFNPAELLARINTGTRVIGLERSLKKAYREIKALSITDSITGCYNRRYLEEKLPGEIKRARRYRRDLSVVMCDIDHFKTVNDTYGHQVGDMVLNAFAQRIGAAIRKDIDWMSRYGGEEFFIVFPETCLENTFKKADMLRRMISGKKVGVCGRDQIFITASFGVSGIETLSNAEEITAAMLIKEADDCLYQAKSTGRNRVVKSV